MSERGLVFVGAGLLFTLRPSAAVRYPDGQRLVRYVAALVLVVLGILIALEITIQYRQ